MKDRQSSNCQHQWTSASVYLELKAENCQHTHTLQSTREGAAYSQHRAACRGLISTEHPYKNHDALAWRLPNNKMLLLRAWNMVMKQTPLCPEHLTDGGTPG